MTGKVEKSGQETKENSNSNSPKQSPLLVRSDKAPTVNKENTKNGLLFSDSQLNFSGSKNKLIEKTNSNNKTARKLDQKTSLDILNNSPNESVQITANRHTTSSGTSLPIGHKILSCETGAQIVHTETEESQNEAETDNFKNMKRSECENLYVENVPKNLAKQTFGGFVFYDSSKKRSYTDGKHME